MKLSFYLLWCVASGYLGHDACRALGLSDGGTFAAMVALAAANGLGIYRLFPAEDAPSTD